MNAQTTARTAGPWEVKGRYVFGNNGNRTVADCGSNGSYELTEANAAFIVQACNAHDDLVAALRALREVVGWLNVTPEGYETVPPHIVAEARAALAKAGAL